MATAEIMERRIGGTMRGVAKVRGLGGVETKVIVISAGREEDMAVRDYDRALLQPPYEDLPWRRAELAPLPDSASDDFDADRGQDAKIIAINPANLGVNSKTPGGWLTVDWERRLRPLELQRYKNGVPSPSWLEEYETIYAEDILAVSAALKAADPKDEAALAAALSPFQVERNVRTDRK